MPRNLGLLMMLGLLSLFFAFTSWGDGGRVLTVEENEIGRNRVHGNAASTVALEGDRGHGFGIALDYSHRNRVFANKVEDNGDAGIILENAALNVVSSNVITGHEDSGILIHDGVRDAANTIERNEIGETVRAGIRIKSGYSEIRQNEISANGGRGVVRAEENWWGDASGPYHPELHTAGQGDGVSDDVDFRPWRTAQVGG